MPSIMKLGLIAGTAAVALAAPTPPANAIVCEVDAPQSPFTFPLANGFPNPNATALKQIEEEAHGTLPNSALPPKIADLSAVVWELISFNEIFEVAFFSSLLQNITQKVPGFDLSNNPNGDQIIDDLYAIRAQEEIHALGANTILKTAGRTQVSPCEYKFPTSDFVSAISFASEFTDVVLGTLQEALFDFGMDGDLGFLEIVGGVIGQEGEQNGAFRILEGLKGAKKIPSALPFLTVASARFAYSELMQNVVVPGSCAASDSLAALNPVLAPLSITTPVVSNTTTSVNFAFNSTGLPTTGLSLVYINQQNVPVVEQLTNVSTANGMTSFTAPFPYTQYEMNGLTIAAVAQGSSFTNASAVASAAIAGPGLIEIK